jgi:hypothetical protein
MTKPKSAKKSRKAPAGMVKARIADAGKRALEEAEARRKADCAQERPAERGGRQGPEPTRYGDWEKKGIISDF